MLHDPLTQKTLEKLDIAALNDLQVAALAALPRYPDCTLLSPTGSGKTLAFLLPVLHLLHPEADGVQCLVVSPTRELAIQIERVWQKMGTGYKVSTCYGGHDMTTETNNLVQPPALLIGTPGRLVEHLTRGTFDPRTVRILILDEFDKSLSMGFTEQMTEIIQTLKNLERRVLASATNKLSIPDFVGMGQPHILNFSKKEAASLAGLEVRTVTEGTLDKRELLFRLLCHIGPESTLIFCNQRDAVGQTNAFLKKKGLDSAAFHGGMEQLDREKALIRFRNGSTTFLVASDLAARGLDIPEVRHVVHFEMPPKHTDFVHRNGRTARMHADGTAYVLVGPDESLPVYLDDVPERLPLPERGPLPPAAVWSTLYISGGKKEKLSKVDIVGFLGQKGLVSKDDIGKIEVLDHMSFVAIRRDLVPEVLTRIANEKMKGARYKINEAW
jgi:ATP-dependent RNA helicase DbpA